MPNIDYFSFLTESLHVDAVKNFVRKTSKLQLLWIFVYSALVVGGYSGQIIFLNLWLAHFVSPNSAMTVLLTVAISTFLLYAAMLAVYGAIHRPSLGFLRSLKGTGLLLLLGLSNGGNGLLLVFATPHTPELFQALLLAGQVIWTMILAKILLRDDRSYTSWVVVSSVTLCVGGIISGFASQIGATPMDESAAWWTVIFLISTIPGALYNVLACAYLRKFSIPEVLQGGASSTATKGEGLTVKLAMLMVSSITQLCLFIPSIPLGGANWFGSGRGVSASFQYVADGWKCMFQGHHIDPMCELNAWYGVGFLISYACSYFGGAYLAKASAALTAMVTQLASPMAALILLLAPSLNVARTPIAVLPTIAAVVMLSLAAVLYAAWEQSDDVGDTTVNSGLDVDSSPWF